jgi:hypothetical protein
MQLTAKLFCTVLALTFIVGQPSLANDIQRNQAKRIHDRLTGVPATNAVITTMESALAADSSGKSAAAIAIDPIQNPLNYSSFYNVTLKNFATPWTNEEQTVFAPLNDYTATVIGMIRDDVDFREILSGNILYTGNNSPAYANNSNAHYEALENLGPVAGNLANTGILLAGDQTTFTGLPDSATAGVITSRAAAKSFFSDGTNRAMFRFTLINHLCTDLEPLKDISRTPDRIRQDVSRSPGGDSRIFINSCVGCHAGMDGMASAYAYYEYDYTNDVEDGQLSYTPGSVQAKHLINPDNFKPGTIMTDDSWVNYWRNGQNGTLAVRTGSSGSGWTHPGEILDTKDNALGSGAKSLGIELANSKAFAQCQVDKVFRSVCFRDPNDKAADRTTRNTVVDAFVAGGYKMKQVFGDVAAACKGN